MNSLRRKSRGRQQARPSLLSYHQQSSAAVVGINGIAPQYLVTPLHSSTQYQPANVGNVQQQYYAAMPNTIENVQCNVKYANKSYQYNVPLSDRTNQYNVSLGNTNRNYIQKVQNNVRDLRYNVPVNVKVNQFQASETSNSPHYLPYNTDNQQYAEKYRAKKSKYEKGYENKYQDYENVNFKNVVKPQVQLTNLPYNNNISPTQIRDNRYEIPIIDSPIQHTPTNYNYSNLYDQERSLPSSNSSRSSTPKDLTKRKSRTGLARQPSFRQHQIGNSNTAIASSGMVNKTVEGVMKRRKHLVFLGLDGAGKTTILMRLKYRCFMATTPTVGFNHEKVWGGGYRWSAWDVGGGERLRPLWATYSRGTDCVVYVVDATANDDTMEEARLELIKIMKVTRITAHQSKKLPPPLLVMANFQDRSNARNAPEIAKSLNLDNEGAGAVSSCWAVACVCGVTGEGLDDALTTLRQLLDRGSNPSKTKARPLDMWR